MKEHRKGWHPFGIFGQFEELPTVPHVLISHPARLWCPPTDVFECDESIVIRLSISGLRKDAQGHISNAEVTVEGDTVTIRGRREDDTCFKKCNFYQMEIYYGPFECRVTISTPFDADGIEARYENGFLDVIVPKAQTGQRGVHSVPVRS